MKTIRLILTVFLIFSVAAVSAQEKKEYKPNTDGVYFEVEVMPEFQGGISALQDYLIKNIQYPEQAKKDSITGKVYVQFIVDEIGKVGGTKVLKSVNPLLDAEAIRVISSMPAWIPGKNNGKTIKVAYTIPIMFALK
jgi:TonB family protein